MATPLLLVMPVLYRLLLPGPGTYYALKTLLTKTYLHFFIVHECSSWQ
jgi:hypothetical protein